jgi:hypothetical protein
MSLSGDPGATPYSQTPAGDDGYSYIPNDSNAKFVIEIGCYVAGVKTVLQTWSYLFWTYWITAGGYNLYVHNVGHTYYVNSANHVFAFEVTSYAFEVDFSGLSLTVSDGSHVSQKGASYLSGGFSDSSTDVSLKMSWDFYDSGPTAGPGTAFVESPSGESTSSISYADLATTTDQVTVNIGASGLALVNISATCLNFNAGSAAVASFAVSGASTVAADDSRHIFLQSATASNSAAIGASFLMTGLTAGATTFKMKYRVDGGTGSFYRRTISVIPL